MPETLERVSDQILHEAYTGMGGHLLSRQTVCPEFASDVTSMFWAFNAVNVMTLQSYADGRLKGQALLWLRLPRERVLLSNIAAWQSARTGCVIRHLLELQKGNALPRLWDPTATETEAIWNRSEGYDLQAVFSHLEAGDLVSYFLGDA